MTDKEESRCGQGPFMLGLGIGLSVILLVGLLLRVNG